MKFIYGEYTYVWLRVYRTKIYDFSHSIIADKFYFHFMNKYLTWHIAHIKLLYYSPNTMPQGNFLMYQTSEWSNFSSPLKNINKTATKAKLLH